MGWIGPLSQLLYYLSTVNADRDEHGNFYIVGEQVVTFLGMTGPDAEAVVSERVSYLSKGMRLSLAGGLNSTSYGMKVNVI